MKRKKSNLAKVFQMKVQVMIMSTLKFGDALSITQDELLERIKQDKDVLKMIEEFYGLNVETQTIIKCIIHDFLEGVQLPSFED